MKTNLSYPVLLLYIICVTAQAQQPTLEWANRYSGTDKTNDTALAIAVDAADKEFLYTTPPVPVIPCTPAG